MWETIVRKKGKKTQEIGRFPPHLESEFVNLLASISDYVHVLENCLQDFKSRAQEMNVGVNYNALEEERKRQELLLQELRDIESKLSTPSIRKTSLPNLASLVGVELEQNTKCLHYLTGISELERYISDVATHFAERSIELSDPQALHRNVFSYKTLTDNVKSCWDYVEQLAMLAQIHIKTSAEYHQFFHEANEVGAKLEKQFQIAQRRQNALTEQDRRIKDASKIANEVREQLENMRNLWNRCIALVKRSESVVPIRLRLGGVSEGEITLGSPNSRNGPVLVRALVSLTGPAYRIKQGELLRLIDNQSDTHLWKVQTSSGIEEVPSVCFWITGNDAEAIEKAAVLKQHCKKTWLEIVRLTRRRLYLEYIDILNRLATKNAICIKQKAFTDLIADIHTHLIIPEEDDDQLRIAVENFQRSVIFTRNAINEGEYVLKESDLVQLRSPLLRLQDHLMAVGLMQEETKRLNEYIENYLSEVKNDQKRISKMADHLKRITTVSQIQLADLSSQLTLYTEDATKRPQYTRPEIDDIYRSRSQPFDIEVSSKMKRKLDRKRARSQTVDQLDAMVQIGSKCRSIETQSVATTSGTEDSMQMPKQRRSESRIPQPPVQRCVMTQIGPSSKESYTQMDSSESSTSEECYVTEIMKANVRRYPDNENCDRRRDARSPSVHNRRPVIKINSCTQLGTLTHERSASPILSLINCCPQCQRHGLRCRLVCEHVSTGTSRTYDLTESYCQTLSSHGSTVRYVNHDYANSCTQIGTITRDCVVSPVCCDVILPARRSEVERPPRARSHNIAAASLQASHRENAYIGQVGRRINSQEIQHANVDLEYATPCYSNIARSNPNIDRVYRNTVNARRQREGRCEVRDRRTRRVSETEIRSSKLVHAVPVRYTTGNPYRHTASLPNLASNESDMIYTQIPRVAPRTRRNGQTVGSHATSYTTVVAPEISRSTRVHCHSVPNVYERQVQIEHEIDSREYQTRDVVTCEGVSYAPHVRTIGGMQHSISLPTIASPCYARVCVPACRPVTSTCMCRPCVRTFTTQVCEAPEVVEPVRDIGIAEMEIIRVVKPEREVILQPVRFVCVGTPVRKHFDVSCDAMIVPDHASKKIQIELFEEPVIYEAPKEEHVYVAPPIPMQTVMAQSVLETHGKKLQFEPEMIDAICGTLKPEPYEVIACQKEIRTRGKKLQVTIEVPEPMKLGIGEVCPVKKAGHGKKLQVDLAIPLQVDMTQTIAEPEKSVADFQCDAIQPASLEVGTSQSIWEEMPPIVLQQEVTPVFAAPVKLTNDFSCDAPIPPDVLGKKLQVTPLPLEITATQALYEENFPEPLLIGTAQSIIEAPVATKEFSCEPIPVITQSKKLQVSPEPLSTEAVQALHTEIEMATAVTQTEVEPIVEKIGKKLQVAPPPLASSSTQAIYEEPVPELLYIGQSQSIWEEPEPIIIKPPTPEPIVMAAPPKPTNEFSCNPVPIMTDFKTVQVVPKPVVTNDFGCDALLAITVQDFSCDAPEPVQTAGKKLQVMPAPLASTVSQSIYVELEKIAKAFQVGPEPMAITIAQVSYVEPALTVYERYAGQVKEVEKVGKKLQVMPEPLEAGATQTIVPAPVEKVGKKLQVSPTPLEVGVSQAIYGKPRPEPLHIGQSQATWVEPEPIIIKPPTPEPIVMAAPPPSIGDFGCNPIPIVTEVKDVQVAGEKFAITTSQAIYTPVQLSISSGQSVYKETRLESGLAQCVAVMTKDSACDAPAAVEGVGKKLQVSPSPLAAVVSQSIYIEEKPTPFNIVRSQTIYEEVKPEPLLRGVSQAMYTEPKPESLHIGVTQAIWEESPPIVLKQDITPVFSAPITESKDFSCEIRPVEILTKDFSCDAPAPVETMGKKLQVSPPPMAASSAQATYKEVKSEPLIVASTQSPIVEAPSMKEFSCDPITVETVGKKLQVYPEPLVSSVSQSIYFDMEKITKAFQVGPEPMAITVAQVSYVEPKVSVYERYVGQVKEMEKIGKKLQVQPESLNAMAIQALFEESKLSTGATQTIEPAPVEKVGKKLQVSPEALMVNVSQTTHEEPRSAPLGISRAQSIWVEPEPVIIKPPTPEPIVMAAPPPSIGDFSCNPISIVTQFKEVQVAPVPLVVAGSQSVYVEPRVATKEIGCDAALPPQTAGKKLQVAPTPLAAISTQVTYVEEKPLPLDIGGSQAIYEELKPIPLATVNSQAIWIEHQPVETREFSCDAPRPIESVGKKLQVSPEPLALATSQSVYMEPVLPKYGLTAVQAVVPPLAANVCQTAFVEPRLEFSATQVKYAEPTPEPLVVGRSQSLWVEPEPVIIKPPTPEPIVMAAPPPPPTNDFTCGPLPVTSVGKKLQVSPEPLVSTTSQAIYAEPAVAIYERNVAQCRAPEMQGKKLQVAPEPLNLALSQSIYVEPKPIPLVTGATQAIWVEPAPIPVRDFSCDAPRPIESVGKKLQVSPEPLALATSQSVYMEPVLPKYGLTAVQAVVPPLAANVCQTAFVEPRLEFSATQVKYAEPTPEPLVVGRSQSLWVEPEPVIIKPPTPEPIVMAAPPPPPTNDFTCGPLPVTSVGKKLQVSPEPLVSTTSQAIYAEPAVAIYERNVAQCRAPEMQGKKLQVAPEPLRAANSQTIYVEEKPVPLLSAQTQAIFIESKPAPLAIVRSQAILRDFITATDDFSCDSLRIETFGKKLQVDPEPLMMGTSQSIYVKERPIPLVISRTQSIWVESQPAPLTKTIVQASYTEPRLPAYERCSVQCRAVEMLGKKLQVMPEPLTASALQTIHAEPVPAALDVTRVQAVYEETPFEVERTQVLWVEPEPIIIKPPTPEPIVMAAPSQPTKEFSCSPLQLDTDGKELQVSPEPLSRAVANITTKPIPMVTSRSQTTYVEAVMPTYAGSVAQCIPVETMGKKLQVTPQPVTLSIGRSNAILVEPRRAITTAQTLGQVTVTKTREFSCDPLPSNSHGKKLQVLPEPMATAIMQSPDARFSVRNQTVYVEEPLHAYRSCAVQCRPIPTLGKKLQVAPEPLTTTCMQLVQEEPARMIYKTTEVQGRPAETVGKKLQVQPLPLTSAKAQTTWVDRARRDVGSVTDVVTTAHASIAPVVINRYGKKLQVTPEPMGIAIMQSGQPEQRPKIHHLTIGHANTVKEEVRVDHKGLQFVPEGVSTASQFSEVQKLGKKLQVQPVALSTAPAQTIWEEPIVIRSPSPERIVMAAPPMELPSVEKVNKKLMVRPPLLETLYVQSTIEATPRVPLSTREVQADISLPTPIIKPASPIPHEYAAPPIIRETDEAGMQHEVNMRSVRIQKGVGAFEGTANIGIQFSPPEPRRSPPVTRVRTVEWGIQFAPTAMVGITQTLPIERVPSPRRPATFTESTQTEVHREGENLFSFIRETKTKVSKERRARSQGLISYKTQVSTRPRDHAVSVPSMLHVMESGAEQYLYQQQKTTSTHIPRRYVRGGTFERRMRSMDTVYEDGSNKTLQASLPRHSESDLYTDKVYMREILRTQQLQLEERSMDHLQRIVRSIGMEKVQSMLRQIWEETEEELAISEEIHGGIYTPRPFPGLRFADVETQHTVPAYGIVYGTDFSVQEGISYVQWKPLALDQTVHIESDESTGYDETYDWDPYQSSWRPRRNFFQWVARTAFDFATQKEVTKEEENQFIDRLLRSRALNAYTSDFEMQQAGLKLNYPESGTVSVVSWKPRYMDGEDQLDVDTIGRLLRVSLVGARVPGTGEIISAADAFYRGILRMVYVDDNRGNIMPLPTAIVTNAVIVEKQYPKGVGIALHSTSRRFPVECQELWRTATLRRRTYRVNFIQKSPVERVDLSRALDEGLIDLTSGELVKITPPTSEAQPEPRESTLEAGESIVEAPQPVRYSVHEAILYDILDVELLAPETVIFTSAEMSQEGVTREGEILITSPGLEEEESDMEV
ncbi:hypothetical protein ACTXT7_003619 [Hymenolepis weldensis]